MKEKELRKIIKCAFCGKPFGHTQIPLFWRVSVQRFGVNLDAMKRQDGLSALLGGNVTLANAMGADEEIANPMTDKIEFTVCEECADEPVRIYEFLTKGEKP